MLGTDFQFVVFSIFSVPLKANEALHVAPAIPSEKGRARQSEGRPETGLAFSRSCS